MALLSFVPSPIACSPRSDFYYVLFAWIYTTTMERTFLPYTADEVILMIPSIVVEIREDFLPLQGGPERLLCEDAMKIKLKMQRRFWDVGDVRTTGKGGFWDVGDVRIREKGRN